MSYFTEEIERLRQVPVRSENDTLLNLTVAWGAGTTIIRIIDALAEGVYNNFCPEIYIADCVNQHYEESGKFDWYPPTGWIFHWRTANLMYASIKASGINKENLNYVYSLRDPRDIIVSRYFSEVYSHSPPQNPEAAVAYHTRIEQMKQMGVDAWCLENFQYVLNQYAGIRQFFSDVPSGRQLFVSYCCLVLDTPAFVRKVANFMGSALSAEGQAALAHAESIEHPDDNRNFLLNLHHASPVPGRFRGELARETQTTMNEMSRDCRDWLKDIDPTYRGLYT